MYTMLELGNACIKNKSRTSYFDSLYIIYIDGYVITFMISSEIAAPFGNIT